MKLFIGSGVQLSSLFFPVIVRFSNLAQKTFMSLSYVCPLSRAHTRMSEPSALVLHTMLSPVAIAPFIIVIL